MNVNLEILLGECRARHLPIDAVMAALAAAMVVPVDIAVRPATWHGTTFAHVDGAAPAAPSAASAAPPVAPPPPVAVPTPPPAPLAVRVPDALAQGSPYVDASGANWRDSAGTWFDANLHAWNRAGHPAVAPSGRFRAKRAGSAPPTPLAGDPAGDQAGSPPGGNDGEGPALSAGDALDLSLQLKECAEVHGPTELERFEEHFEAMFEDWQSGTAAEQAAYREVQIAIDAKREELAERLPVGESAGQGHASV